MPWRSKRLLLTGHTRHPPQSKLGIQDNPPLKPLWKQQSNKGHERNQVPWRGKHPLLTGYTRLAPLVEMRYTGLPVVKVGICFISKYSILTQMAD
jgi:hypothetical protein